MRVVATVAAVVLVTAAPVSSVPDELPRVVPGAAWATATPEQVGLDPDALERIAADAGDSLSSCFAVVRHGYLVGEWYWNFTSPDSSREAFSVAKSVTGALVGIAEGAGALDLDDAAADFIPQWRETESAAVTVEHLVSNDSGREWSRLLDYGALLVAPNRSEFAIGLGQNAQPGTTWAYNNAAVQTLSEVLQSATGVEPAEYAAEHLFGPLGMVDTRMTADLAGNTLTFMGLRSTCRDLARFGLLYLNRGDWGGTQVVPAEWVDASVGQPSTELNAAYGYLWWLNRPGTVAGPDEAVTIGSAEGTSAGPLVPGAPDDMYWALGFGDQVVQVDPGSDTVVVRMGLPLGGFGRDDTARVVTEAVVD